MGVESNFGRYTGNHNVVGALSTLAFDGRREALFRKQTIAALQIIDEGHISAEDMKGSWAGAMGQCQFMPTSFLAYAQDGNNDGKKDIWTTTADVFASTANYLKPKVGTINTLGDVKFKYHMVSTLSYRAVMLRKVNTCKNGKIRNY